MQTVILNQNRSGEQSDHLHTRISQQAFGWTLRLQGVGIWKQYAHQRPFQHNFS